jgi:hypothetical protein
MDALRHNWPALLANAAVCLVGFTAALATIRRAGCLLLLPTTIIAYLLTNGAFVAVPLFVSVDVPFPTASEIYVRIAIANAIFIGLAVPAMTWSVMDRGSSGSSTAPKVPLFAPLALGSLGVVCLVYFLVRNPGIFSLSSEIYRASSYEAYIEARNAVGEAISAKAGSGNGPLQLAYGCFFPVVLAMLSHTTGISPGVRRLLQLAALGGMALPAVLIGSRMMLLFTVVFPVVLWRLQRTSGPSLIARIRGSWRTLLLWGVALGAGTGVFQSVVQTNAFEAGWLLLARVFVAPGAVAGGYFLLFPDFFPFRGAGGIFMMPVASDTVDFQMISIAATGIESHANASFLATSYSAAGYAGVAVVSLALVLSAALLDHHLRRISRRLATLLVVANSFGILMLCSVPYRVAVVTNGYLIGPAAFALLVLLHRELARRRTVPAAAALSSPAP